MTNRTVDRRPVLVAVLALVMIIGAAPLTAAQAAVSTVDSADGAGFPLLGWLSLAAVAGLGLMTAGLWVKFVRGPRAS